MINDDDNNNNDNYFIIITCIIIYTCTIVLTSYIFWKKNNNEKHDSEFFRSMCTRIEIIITMIFLFLKQKQSSADICNSCIESTQDSIT